MIAVKRGVLSDAGTGVRFLAFFGDFYARLVGFGSGGGEPFFGLDDEHTGEMGSADFSC